MLSPCPQLVHRRSSSTTVVAASVVAAVVVDVVHASLPHPSTPRLSTTLCAPPTPSLASPRGSAAPMSRWERKDKGEKSKDRHGQSGLDLHIIFRCRLMVPPGQPQTCSKTTIWPTLSAVINHDHSRPFVADRLSSSARYTPRHDVGSVWYY